MDESENLNLPYIMPSQAQKHVTHNEAIRRLDALVHLSVVSMQETDPPQTLAAGARFIVASPAIGLWEGKEGQVAAYQDGVWMYHTANRGWSVWVEDEAQLKVFDGVNWVGVGVPSTLNSLEGVGIGTDSDSVNKLAVTSEASLFTHDGNDHQLKINRAGLSDTASMLFQTNYSGNAEMGLSGDGRFRLKTSADGQNWNDAVRAEDDGSVVMPLTQHVCGAYHAARKKPWQTSSVSYIDVPDLSLVVTPKSDSSRFLVALAIAGYKKDNYSGYVRILRNGVEILSGDSSDFTNGSQSFMDLRGGVLRSTLLQTNFGIDEPASSAPITYKVQVRTGLSAEPIYINNNATGDPAAGWNTVPSSNLLILELAI